MFKDSSLHIAARDSIAWWKAWLIRLIAVLLSLIVCAIVIFGLTKMNPVEVYKGIFSGAVGTSRRAWVTIRDTMVLLLIAIGLTPAFKMKKYLCTLQQDSSLSIQKSRSHIQSVKAALQSV